MSRVSYPPIIVPDEDDEIISFGKHRGTRLSEVGKKEPTYLVWLFFSGKTFARRVEEGVIAFIKKNPATAISAVKSIKKKGGVVSNIDKLDDIEVSADSLADPVQQPVSTAPLVASKSELWGAW